MNSTVPEKFFTLSEIANSISSVLKKTYMQGYWIKAEIAKLNFYEKTGHCYPDLVEKKDSKIMAQMRGTIWASDFARIYSNFIQKTGENLKDGMEILFFTYVEFSPVHGLSLFIKDISPEFTLGNMALEKQKNIQILKDEEFFYKNKHLEFPRLPKNLAVISVDTSKGFQDFKNVIDSYKEFGISYFLFPSILQGDNAIDSIRDQLINILKVRHHFDCVAIIRGGGGDIGLSCYDDLELSKFVATFPIPVLSGIGHSTNQTIVEMVSFQNFITPTELAYFLLSRFESEKHLLQHIAERIETHFGNIVQDENQFFSSISNIIWQNSENLLKNEFQKIERNIVDMKHSAHLKLDRNNLQMEFFAQKLHLLNPIEILKKGYSITSINGKIIKSVKDLTENQHIETHFADGTTVSKLIKINKI